MHFRGLSIATETYFQYGSTITSKTVNRQLSYSLQQIQDSYIVNGLFPYRFEEKVVFVGGACFLKSQLFFVRTLTFTLQEFKEKYGQVCYIYIELSSNHKTIKYTFYHEPIAQFRDRLFLALWKNDQFYYRDPNYDLMRRELAVFNPDLAICRSVSEEKLQVSNLKRIKASSSDLPTNSRELCYDIFLNGIQLLPKLDYEIEGGFIKFRTTVDGVLRVFTYDKIPDSSIS